MDLSKHLLVSMTDTSWIEKYSAEMGEVRFSAYCNKIWKMLMGMKVGQAIYIADWVMPQNYDIFIKVAHSFMSANTDWMFYENYSKIKHTFDSNEIRKSYELLKAKRREIDSERNGGSFDGEGERPEILPAQGQDVSCRPEDESGLPANQTQIHSSGILQPN